MGDELTEREVDKSKTSLITRSEDREIQLYIVGFEVHARWSGRPISNGGFLGAALRGGLGHILKRVFCVRRDKDCLPCPLKRKCLYRKLFEPELNEESLGVFRGIRDLPRPFVFHIKRVDQEGLLLDLQLVGTAIEYYEYFIFVLMELGKAGIGREKAKFNLESVKELPIREGSAPRLIYTAEENIIHNINPVMIERTGFGREAESLREISLKFKSPVRLKQNGEYGWDGDFSVLFKSLLRRIRLLELAYCNASRERQVTRLLEEAARVEVVENDLCFRDQRRWSSKRRRVTLHGGSEGKITYRGDFSRLYPYLKAGELVHVGHNCTFGMGKYEIFQKKLENPSDPNVYSTQKG